MMKITILLILVCSFSCANFSENLAKVNLQPAMQYSNSLTQSTPAQQVDPKCLDDCQQAGYNFNWCQKQCSY